jgi:hypothetical protein
MIPEQRIDELYQNTRGIVNRDRRGRFIAPTADLSALDGCSDIPLNLLKPQKYGANAPYLHRYQKIWRKCTLSAPYFEKIRRKCATVALYLMLYRFLCNAMQRASQKAKKYGANAPQLRAIFLKLESSTANL